MTEQFNSLKTVRLSQLLEVWESFIGWYWFVTEYLCDEAGTLAFGLVRGQEIEWGCFDLDELHALEREKRARRLAKNEWRPWLRLLREREPPRFLPGTRFIRTQYKRPGSR